MARKIKVAVTTASQLLEVYDYDTVTGDINNQYIGAYGGLKFEKENALQDLTGASHLMNIGFPDGSETGYFTIADVESVTVDGVAVVVATLAAFVTATARYMLPESSQLESSGTAISALSSTTPLAAGATWTSAYVQVDMYPSLVISLVSDTSASYGIQYSVDGVTVDSTLTRYYTTSFVNPPHKFTDTRKYARVFVTNTSAAPQTSMRFQTLAGDYGDLNIPLDSTMSKDYDSISVRPSDFVTEVALGRRQGNTSWTKFGGNADVDAAASEWVWEYGGNLTPMTTASTISIVSSSGNDVAAGTGGRTLTIYGIDANRARQVETFTLTGAVPVVSTSTWLGINRAVLSSSGSGQTNAGNITITEVTGGTVQSYIPASASQTNQAFFFTQRNHQALAKWLWINAEKLAGGATPKVTFIGYVMNFDTNTRYQIFKFLLDTTTQSSEELNPYFPFVIPENSLLYFTATTDTNDTLVQVRFDINEVRDVDA